MSLFGWIDPKDYSFNSFLLLERFQIRYMMQGWRSNKPEWRRAMGIALNANPAVAWYFKRRCSECADIVDEIVTVAPTPVSAKEIRQAEVYILGSVEDFTVHTTPEVMAEKCCYIRIWDKVRLFELADFTDKIVLDVGAGTGRLTFAAAEKAAWVYASEPVGTMREFMQEKIAREGIKNVRVCDGFAANLPFPDNTFDIVMHGHAIGDDMDNEVAELTRVCKPGGWLLDCPGDGERNYSLSQDKTSRGFEALHHVGIMGNNVYRYRKQVVK